MKVSGKVGNIKVNLVLSDITQTHAGAYFVPEFDDDVSYGGVGGAVAKAGAIAGMEAYRNFVRSSGKQLYGDVYLTESGGGNAKHLLHLVSLGSKIDEEIDTIKKAVINALSIAADNEITTVSTPALGTGIVGQITGAQSADAMFKAIAAHAKFETRVEEINIVVFEDVKVFRDFERALTSQSYLKVTPGPKGKQLDLVHWVIAKRDEDNVVKPKI